MRVYVCNLLSRLTEKISLLGDLTVFLILDVEFHGTYALPGGGINWGNYPWCSRHREDRIIFCLPSFLTWMHSSLFSRCSRISHKSDLSLSGGHLHENFWSILAKSKIINPSKNWLMQWLMPTYLLTCVYVQWTQPSVHFFHLLQIRATTTFSFWLKETSWIRSIMIICTLWKSQTNPRSIINLTSVCATILLQHRTPGDGWSFDAAAFIRKRK